jgi:C-terminal processing protease CtpA/Prc
MVSFANSAHCLQVGDEIQVVNGEVVIGATHEEVVALIKKGGDKLEMQIRRSTNPAQNGPRRVSVFMQSKLPEGDPEEVIKAEARKRIYSKTVPCKSCVCLCCCCCC